jgi:hypothetical protein
MTGLDMPRKTGVSCPTAIYQVVGRRNAQCYGAPSLGEVSVITPRNPKDQHGQTQHLSPKEIDDLLAYLLSL